MANSENFKISAALKDIIGKELITDEFVAVFELVKNSFDANASKVEVIFENNYEPEKARIIIKDNGKGMNYDDLKDKWLFVAYSAKKLGKENEDYRDKIKSQRVFAGAKGVGRFSCDRLGRFLNLVTVKDESEAKVENLVVNWEDFENVDDEEFVNIKVTHNVLNENLYHLKKGTTLEISGLRDVWDRENILRLKGSLAKLINPNQKNDSDNFSIEILAKEEIALDKELNKKGEKKKDLEIVNGAVKNTIFETLEIKTSNILVKISESGKFIETTLQDRGDLIYYLKEKNPYSNLKNISIYLFQLNRSAKLNFTRTMGMEPIKYGSVFMYKNGFRVYPYGEEADDLLQINRRKQQGFNRFLGTRDLIGRIEIGGEQPELREISSRDGGLVKTSTYFDLLEFFYDYVLKRLENYVVNIIRWGDERIDKETGEIEPELLPKDVKIQILELITGFINSKNIIDIQYNKDFLKIISEKQDKSVDKIIKNINNVAEKSGNPELVKEAKKIEKAVRESKADAQIASIKAEKAENLRQEVEKKLEAVVSQKNFLQSEISDDTKNLESILHHIGLTTNLIKTDLENLVKAINNDSSKEELSSIVKRLSRQNEKITSFSKYFKKVNFNIYTNKLDVDIISFTNEYLENVYKLRDDLRNNRELLNVKIHTTANFEHKIKFSPIDMIIVLDNLISNSSKHGASTVELTWAKQEKGTQLSFKDDGKGINDSIIENVFDFGFTTSRRGSGIGLYHVKEILEKLNGTITVNNKLNKGVEFVIFFKS
ncbi:ATP-binding protein [Mucilaginibacter phyllosphaerae]|uniref:Sensor histidine kinase n=1 Tax=Mucilaginibacter phyllosphaerae TaxID=1812349 RepID=A0A4Y8AA07_9SPHI|nr:sensor histidine kinase [Mucilaginibacter phyllosphaerae]MBB3969910.1 signal transduction histidine kinase [Mucilaginibacter phyllosphaerae]TEW65284.1 sensor histidine kinase [Mucilaginibacter phyllosphaerae]GGH16853.1 histidine kinase [Mucilaginibacter phyllosphaerae]